MFYHLITIKIPIIKKLNKTAIKVVHGNLWLRLKWDEGVYVLLHIWTELFAVAFSSIHEIKSLYFKTINYTLSIRKYKKFSLDKILKYILRQDSNNLLVETLVEPMVGMVYALCPSEAI